MDGNPNGLYGMRILFTSDLHGIRSAYKRFSQLLRSGRYDVGIISGDLMTDTADPRSEEEYMKRGLQAARKPVLFLMGNDDGTLDIEWTSQELIKNLHGRRLLIGNAAFVGYQYTNPFVGGIYEKTEDEQKLDLKMLGNIMDDNTVLVTHGPPYGVLDTTIAGESVGSQALRAFVDHYHPRMHLFGHIHESFGIAGTFVNGSYPNTRKFVEIDFERRSAAVIA
jgi:uncharacterized protein